MRKGLVRRMGRLLDLFLWTASSLSPEGTEGELEFGVYPTGDEVEERGNSWRLLLGGSKRGEAEMSRSTVLGLDFKEFSTGADEEAVGGCEEAGDACEDKAVGT